MELSKSDDLFLWYGWFPVGIAVLFGRQPPYLIAEREKVDDYVVKKKIKTVGAFKDGFANVYSITTRPFSTSS